MTKIRYELYGITDEGKTRRVGIRRSLRAALRPDDYIGIAAAIASEIESFPVTALRDGLTMLERNQWPDTRERLARGRYYGYDSVRWMKDYAAFFWHVLDNSGFILDCVGNPLDQSVITGPEDLQLGYIRHIPAHNAYATSVICTGTQLSRAAARWAMNDKAGFTRFLTEKLGWSFTPSASCWLSSVNTLNPCDGNHTLTYGDEVLVPSGTHSGDWKTCFCSTCVSLREPSCVS